MKPVRASAVCVAVIVAILAGTPAAGSDRIVASIKPVHSLVAAVMGETGKPFLIIHGGTSPHSYTLKPSVAKKIGAAKIIFWIGERLESSLTKPIEALGKKARLVTLSLSPGIKPLAFRKGGLFESHEHKDLDHSNSDEIDNHFWLDPANAIIFVARIEQALSAAHPANRKRYRANARTLVIRLNVLSAEIGKRLQPVRDRPFIVFHDAYRYFENRFGLKALGTIVVNPDRKPGARRLSTIRKKIREAGAICVFSEPQFTPKLIRVVTNGTGARTGILDPIGARLTPGPALYFQLMRNMATAFVNCFGARPATR